MFCSELGKEKAVLDEEKEKWSTNLSNRYIDAVPLDIYVAKRDGSNKKRLTNNGATNWSPSWHPDGKHIVFSSNMDDWREDYNPKYVEVSFSNTCNFKCSYCGPQYSSKWVEEINQFGPYKTSTRFNDIELSFFPLSIIV